MSGKLKYWTQLKTTDFAGVAPESCVALLPVGAVEQHGPHLPLGTDGFILDAVLQRLAAASAAYEASGDLNLLVLPTQMVGDSVEHADFPGTLSLRAENLIEAWTSLGSAVAAAGVRKLAIVNSHGGQRQIVDIVAQRLRAEHAMLVGRIHTFLLGVPVGLFDADELAFAFHGGAVETSMMLAIAPDLVDMEASKNFPNLAVRLAKKTRALQAEGGAGFAWQAQDLNPDGVTGNAASADAGRGAATLDHIAHRLAEALAEMAAFPLSDLRDGPR